MAGVGKFIRAFGYFSLCALGLTVGGGIALADGMARGGSVKDAPAQLSWQGFYIGTHAGLANGDTQGVTPVLTTDYDVTGSLVGAQIGYNWQRGMHVFGVEGSYSFSTVQGNTACLFVFDCKREVDSVATLVGRYGLAFGNSLYYGMAGAAWADVNTKVSVLGTTIDSADEHRFGWVAGFGFEHMLSDRLTARIEYAHIDLGSDNQTILGAPDKVDLKMDTIRLGVNLKLSN